MASQLTDHDPAMTMSHPGTPSPTSPPVPVISLAYAGVEVVGRYRGWRRVNRLSLAVGTVVTLGAWVGVLVEVESVLFSGPTLALLGVLMILGGLLRRQPWVWAIGTAHLAVCLLFTALVNLLSWSPKEADVPFTLMGAAYNLLSVPACVVAWVRRVG